MNPRGRIYFGLFVWLCCAWVGLGVVRLLVSIPAVKEWRTSLLQGGPK